MVTTPTPHFASKAEDNEYEEQSHKYENDTFGDEREFENISSPGRAPESESASEEGSVYAGGTTPTYEVFGN